MSFCVERKFYHVVRILLVELKFCKIIRFCRNGTATGSHLQMNPDHVASSGVPGGCHGGRPLPTRIIFVRSQNIACFVCRAYTYISYYSYVALLAVYTAYATWFGPLERKSRVGQPAGTPLVATTNDSDFRAALNSTRRRAFEFWRVWVTCRLRVEVPTHTLPVFTALIAVIEHGCVVCTDLN